MTPDEFREWCKLAIDQGCVEVQTRRTGKGRTEGAATVFSKDVLKGIDCTRLLERMRDDLKARRITVGTFKVAGIDDAGKVVMHDQVNLARDEVLSEDEQLDQDPGVALARIESAHARQAFSMMLDMAGAQKDFVVAMTGTMTAMATHEQAQRGEFFDMMTFRHERDTDAAASADKRAIAKGAVEVLGPIAGALIAHVSKQATPAWAAFAQKLINNPDKFQSLIELLSPDEVMALETALGMTFPKKPAKEETTNGSQGR
jgi:hypothetical protein